MNDEHRMPRRGGNAVGRRFELGRWRIPLGFLLTFIWVLRAHPSVRSLALGLPIAAVGLALRAWAAGYIRKNDALATSGPYSYTRNPLYLGSTLLGIGFVLAGADWWMSLGVALLFVLVYLPVIRREEAFLRSRFGEEFNAYAGRVPRLLPRWGDGTTAGTFSASLYLRHREYNALLGYLGLTAVLLLRLWGVLPQGGGWLRSLQ